MSDVLDQIDRATGGLCECGCGQPVPPDGPSAWFAEVDCQRRWHEARADRPQDVYEREDAAPYPRGPMRWRPDLVTEAPDDGLTLLSGPTRHGQFTRRVYGRDGTTLVHLRVDDGHRFAGCDVETIGGGEEFGRRCDEAWRRLERELTNPRRTATRTPLREEPAVGQWQRRCPTCRRHGVPQAGMRVPPTRMRWTPGEIYPLDAMPEPERCQLCPHCRNPYPGPPLRAAAHWDGMHFGFVLRVTTAEGPDAVSAQTRLPEVEVLGVYNPETHIQQQWDRLDEQVTTTARICVWLRANDIDPNLTPEDSPITTTRTLVAVDQYQPAANGGGGIALDENGNLRRVTRQFPLIEPWPEDLHHPNHIDLDLVRESVRRSAEQAREAVAVLAEQLAPVADAFRRAFQGVAADVEAARRPPLPSGRVWVGPLEADPSNPDEWQELGVASDDGLLTASPSIPPIVNRRDAGVLADAGLREGQHFHVYPDSPPEPARHPLLAAIEARRNRNTGPAPNRLDGRSRRR